MEIWGVAGFCVTGLTYSGTCLWAQSKLIEALGIYAKIGVGLGGSFVSCLICGGLSVVYTKCKKHYASKKEVAVIHERLLTSVSDEDFKQTQQLGSSYQVTASHLINRSSEVFDRAWRKHTIKCNQVVADFFQSRSVGTGTLHSYLLVARELRNAYPKLLDSQYFSQLKLHGYDYHSLPADLFMQLIPANSAPIDIIVREITPPTSPHTPAERSPEDRYLPTYLTF